MLDEFLIAVDWRGAFGSDDGKPLDAEDIGRLIAYYQEKFSDIGPVYLAELMSTEFMTELRARGDVVFSDRLLEIGRNEPELWKEIRAFFRRKEFATAMLVNAHRERQERRGGSLCQPECWYGSDQGRSRRIAPHSLTVAGDLPGY